MYLVIKLLLLLSKDTNKPVPVIEYETKKMLRIGLLVRHYTILIKKLSSLFKYITGIICIFC